MPSCLLGVAFTLRAQVDDPPPPPPPPPKIVLTKFVPPAKELKEFYRQNRDVANLYWKSENDIVVVLKDKKQFVYNMQNKQEKEAFEEKYGLLVISMPPSPPPPPPPPKKVS